MKAGSKVHKKLEDEVHETVKVDISSREDAFGLKIWNIIQGLRTLRETGLTRELEVWGIIDGQIVNGLIDVLSHESPNSELEEDALSRKGGRAANPEDTQQQRITTFFPSEDSGRVEVAGPKVYLTDVKTRGTHTLPSVPAMRPTKIQLFLYHRLLSDMASDKLDYLQVITRYGLNPDELFSDSFIAQIGGLHEEIFYDIRAGPTTAPPARSLHEGAPASDDDASNLIRYPTLRSVIPLLINELRLTFPNGAESLGVVVTAEYRLRARMGSGSDANVKEPGHCIGTNVTPVDYEVLDKYLAKYMQWWRGERKAEGVAIEEASYKCGYCEFAASCGWRKGLDDEKLRMAHEKLASKNQSRDDADRSRSAELQ